MELGGLLHGTELQPFPFMCLIICGLGISAIYSTVQTLKIDNICILQSVQIHKVVLWCFFMIYVIQGGRAGLKGC